jgi:hypothetical protein
MVPAPGTSIALLPRHCEALRAMAFHCRSFLPRRHAALLPMRGDGTRSLLPVCAS